MRKIRLAVQYDGTEYSGWQIQKKEITVQGRIEKAVNAVAGEPSRVTGAGRTDAGVHALHQVACFETSSGIETSSITPALNANLPPDIRILGAEECPANFHPRFSASTKTYTYLISDLGAYSVFINRYSWQVPSRLDRAAMKTASDCLLGRHDFSSFRASGCSSRHPVREIKSIKITESDHLDFMNFRFDVRLIKISIRANAFLRHMARNITGTLVEIGRGRKKAEQIKDILEAKDRKTAGQTAPGKGLFLESINYSD